MPAPPAHQALMEEIARLEELAREWIGLFPQAATPGPALAEGAVPGPGPRGGGHLPPGGGGRGEIRQEHHDQRPGGPGPFAPGRRDPHGHGHPGPTRPGSRRRCSGSRGGTKSTGRSAGPWGFCPIPGWWTGPSPWTCRQAPDRELLAQVLAEAREADLWTGGSLDQNYLLLKSYLEGYDLLQDLMPATGALPLTGPDLARHRDLVTREATAVYLKDVLLTIPFPWPAAGRGVGRLPGERFALSPAPGPGPGLSHQERPGALRRQLPGGAAPGGFSVSGGVETNGADAPYPGPAQPGSGGAHLLCGGGEDQGPGGPGVGLLAAGPPGLCLFGPEAAPGPPRRPGARAWTPGKPRSSRSGPWTRTPPPFRRRKRPGSRPT